ncbi:hypothetical protein SpCBS45565_g05544 [Spizellomyces sp. 'palustris']|nr:hypothetical protein SpCBS45565_g05544 [Spizellomyces sp. 'palustris']
MSPAKTGATPPAPTTFLDGAAYTVTQTEDSLTITLPVPDEFDPKRREGDVVEIQENTLLVKVQGEETPRLSGWLFHPIDKFDSVYDLQRDARTDLRLLNLNLTKAGSSDSFMPAPAYPVLFSSGLNTPAPMPKDAALDDMDPHSLFLLADWMLKRLAKPDRALAWYSKAAERGSIMACLKLGAWFELGKDVHKDIPVERDRAKAFEYHLRAADLGHPEACLIVSEWFAPMSQDRLIKLRPGEEESQSLDVQAQEKDFATAVSYLDRLRDIVSQHRATQAPSTRELMGLAMWRAGVLYAEGGNGLPSSAEGISQSFAYFSTAALDYRHPRALWSLSLYYINGFGCDQNISQGVEMLKEALAADPKLDLPPQFQGLDGIGLDILVGVEKEARTVNGVEPGKILDVESLVNAARRVVENAGGKEKVEDTVEKALKELELSVVKVNMMEEPATKTEAKVEEQPPVEKTAKLRKRRVSKAKAKAKTRTRNAGWSGMEVTLGVGIVAAVGAGLWIWMRSSKVKA